MIKKKVKKMCHKNFNPMPSPSRAAFCRWGKQCLNGVLWVYNLIEKRVIFLLFEAVWFN